MMMMMVMMALLRLIPLFLTTAVVALFLMTNNIAADAGVVRAQQQTASEQKAENFRWASAGGGWRAMVADMAYANVLTQAGLFTDTFSNFSSISAQSGGSWFAAQFFFAEPFYQNVTQSTPDQLATFVTSWMDSYQTYTAQFLVQETTAAETILDNDGGDENNSTTNTTTTTDACDDLKALNVIVQSSFLQSLIDHCIMLVALNGDWARLVSEMLDQAARDYYGISSNSTSLPSSSETTSSNNNNFFSTAQASPGSRVAALQQTDFYIQTVLVPNSRLRGNASTENYQPDIGVSIGHSLDQEPENETEQEVAVAYTLPIGLQYQLSSSSDSQQQRGTSYLTSSPDESFPDFLVTFTTEISANFTFDDYRSYDLYPGNTTAGPTPKMPGVLYLNATALVGASPFSLPFDGQVPTIGQLCGASSAAIGTFSGLVPSTMAQAFSVLDFSITHSSPNQTDEEKLEAQATLDAIFNDAFYNNPLFDDVSVCSQWPNLPCGESDGRLIDGEFSDSPTLGLNIAHYQSVQNGTLSQTLKLLVTPGNVYGGSIPIGFVSYFNNSFNQGIEPGAFYWPSTAEQGPLIALPIYSPQLFSETLDVDAYLAMLQPIDGLPTVSTMTIRATTVTNPIFKIKASQAVEIFVIQLNSSIPTDILGVTSIEKWTGPLAEMASSIAASQELVNRVKAFFDPTGSAPVPSPSLTPSNATTMEPTPAEAPSPASTSSEAASISISLPVLVGLATITTINVMVSAMS